MTTALRQEAIRAPRVRGRVKAGPPESDEIARPYRFPFSPYPTSWYALGRAADFRSGPSRMLHRFGRDLLVGRAADARLTVQDGACPHRGSSGEGALCGECLAWPVRE